MGNWAPAWSLQVVLGGRRRSAVDAKEVMEEPEAIKAAKRLVSQLVNLGFMNCNLSKVCVYCQKPTSRDSDLSKVLYILSKINIRGPFSVIFIDLSLILIEFGSS